MAREYKLSRTAIYDIAERASILFEPRLPGPVPCLKRLLPCGAMPSQASTETEMRSHEEEEEEEEERMRARLILTSLFPGGVTMRPFPRLLVLEYHNPCRCSVHHKGFARRAPNY